MAYSKYNTEIKDYDLFLSYQWDYKKEIKELYNILIKEFNFTIWMDDHETRASGNLMKQLANGLNNSKCVLCFITEKYGQSKNCITEITYAYSNDIPFIAIMLERISPKDLGEVGIIISQKVRLNLYKEEKSKWWSSETFEALINSVYEFVPKKKNYTANEENKNVLGY